MEQKQYIPPVEIHDYQQFLSYARRAKIVTFEPVYHVLPVESEMIETPIRWLKFLNIYAIGVDFDGTSLTLFHKVMFPSMPIDLDEGVFDEVAVAGMFNSIVTELETNFDAVPGTPQQPSLHEDWIKTLR